MAARSNRIFSSKHGWLASLTVSVIVAGCARAGHDHDGEFAVAQQAVTSAYRYNMNSGLDENLFVAPLWAIPFAEKPFHQVFMNNLTTLSGVYIRMGGLMTLPQDTLNVRVLDPCGALVVQSSAPFDNSGLVDATSSKWIYVSLNGASAVHGQYYSMEVFISSNRNDSARLLLNTNRYEHGRAINPNSAEVGFPEKKTDLVFYIDGMIDDETKAWMPDPTTNIVCRNRCFLANPSGTENTMWNPRNHFNVLIREKPTVSGDGGSFWSDYNTPDGNGNGIPDGLEALKSEIKDMLEGDAAKPGLRETYPFNNYYLVNNNPPYNAKYYPTMNFYIAVEDPAKDPQRYRGFKHCANIDAIIDVVTPEQTYGGTPDFKGEVKRITPTGWGKAMRFIMIHEVFGHGVSGLDDEYIGVSSKLAVYADAMPNSLPLSHACNEWCTGTRDVEWLKSQMVQDPHYHCWAKTTEAACTPPLPVPPKAPLPEDDDCRWIGNLPTIPYWGSYKCIPRDAAWYNIGVNCEAKGNARCFPLATLSSTGGAKMNLAQPSGSIMQGDRRGVPAAPGFTTGVENYIKDLLDCGFGMAPCAADSVDRARCDAFFARWTTPGNGYMPRIEGARACEENYIRRR